MSSNATSIVEEMRQTYIDDTLQKIDTIDEILSNAGHSAVATGSIDEARRLVHMIAGSAYTFGLAHVGWLCAAWEDCWAESTPDMIVQDVPAWKCVGRILRELLQPSGAPTPATGIGPYRSVLVWSVRDDRHALVQQVASVAGWTLETANDDPAAIMVMARGDVDAVITDSEPPGRLKPDAHVRLMKAVTTVVGIGWIVARDDDASLAGGARSLPDLLRQQQQAQQ